MVTDKLLWYVNSGRETCPVATYDALTTKLSPGRFQLEVSNDWVLRNSRLNRRTPHSLVDRENLQSYSSERSRRNPSVRSSLRRCSRSSCSSRGDLRKNYYS